ncbi:hypothetical protein [Arthrobacter sp. KK5.5]|uniref:hypothetical protein n=1 Tax=Arthrobacter sp. KK5.5 TaxID=3373084 RepID=UPI003EE68961
MGQPRQYGSEDPDRTGSYRNGIREHLRRMRDAIGAGSQPPAERRRLLDLADTIGTTPPIG